MHKPGTIYAIDFDGTCVSHAFPEMGEDCPYAVTTLRKIVSEEGKLILWTMRSNTTEHPVFNDPTLFPCGPGDYLNHAIKWFSDNSIPLWGIQTNPDQKGWTSSNKAYAHVYIDDAAFGAPLLYDPKFSPRPYIDWAKVYISLFPTNQK